MAEGRQSRGDLDGARRAIARPWPARPRPSAAIPTIRSGCSTTRRTSSGSVRSPTSAATSARLNHDARVQAIGRPDGRARAGQHEMADGEAERRRNLGVGPLSERLLRRSWPDAFQALTTIERAGDRRAANPDHQVVSRESLRGGRRGARNPDWLRLPRGIRARRARKAAAIAGNAERAYLASTADRAGGDRTTYRAMKAGPHPEGDQPPGLGNALASARPISPELWRMRNRAAKPLPCRRDRDLLEATRHGVLSASGARSHGDANRRSADVQASVRSRVRRENGKPKRLRDRSGRSRRVTRPSEGATRGERYLSRLWTSKQ